MKYHNQSSHRRNFLVAHKLDWTTKPRVFKDYSAQSGVVLPVFSLPEAEPCACSFWGAAFAQPFQNAKGIPSAGELAAILGQGAGMCKGSAEPEQSGGLRFWASAGALYPCETYFYARNIQGLPSGLYHFAPIEQNSLAPALRLLRPDAETDKNDSPSLSFIISSIFERSSWKYLDRAYRYTLLDAGHLAANLEMLALAFDLPAFWQLNFVDSPLADLLDLNIYKEAPLIILHATPTSGAEQKTNLFPKFSTTAPPDTVIATAHAASLLPAPIPESSPASVSVQPDLPGIKPIASPIILPFAFTEAEKMQSAPSLPEVLQKRRSRRKFCAPGHQQGLTLTDLALLLDSSGFYHPTNSFYGPCHISLITGPSNSLPAGCYLYTPPLSFNSGSASTLIPYALGDFRTAASAACLEQEFAAKAAALVLLWVDLNSLETSPENASAARAYRNAWISAGRFGGRFYLAATALGLHCCGIAAFYDQELASIAVLPPTAAPLYALACG